MKAKNPLILIAFVLSFLYIGASDAEAQTIHVSSLATLNTAITTINNGSDTANTIYFDSDIDVTTAPPAISKNITFDGQGLYHYNYKNNSGNSQLQCNANNITISFNNISVGSPSTLNQNVDGANDTYGIVKVAQGMPNTTIHLENFNFYGGTYGKLAYNYNGKLELAGAVNIQSPGASSGPLAEIGSLSVLANATVVITKTGDSSPVVQWRQASAANNNAVEIGQNATVNVKTTQDLFANGQAVSNFSFALDTGAVLQYQSTNAGNVGSPFAANGAPASALDFSTSTITLAPSSIFNCKFGNSQDWDVFGKFNMTVGSNAVWVYDVSQGTDFLFNDSAYATGGQYAYIPGAGSTITFNNPAFVDWITSANKLQANMSPASVVMNTSTDILRTYATHNAASPSLVKAKGIYTLADSAAATWTVSGTNASNFSSSDLTAITNSQRLTWIQLPDFEMMQLPTSFSWAGDIGTFGTGNLLPWNSVTTAMRSYDYGFIKDLDGDGLFTNVPNYVTTTGTSSTGYEIDIRDNVNATPTWTLQASVSSHNVLNAATGATVPNVVVPFVFVNGSKVVALNDSSNYNVLSSADPNTFVPTTGINPLVSNDMLIGNYSGVITWSLVNGLQ
ncbi:MAG: hypothetical protein LBN08_02465 [Lactobacillales bacterium]|jgi:hypothetical protein|nr:hypothetical protein [Lactobacillales bacterium]